MTTQVYLQPRSLSEALCLLAEHPTALVMAGGTLAVPLVNKGVSLPEKVLGLRRTGLDYVRREDGVIRIGAATPLTKVREQSGIPMLAEAVKNIGGWAVQNMGTAGGNLFAPPPAGDLAVALLALDARIKVASEARGQRMVALSDFYTGFLSNVLQPDELVWEIEVPQPAGKMVLLKHGRLYTNTPAIVTVAVHRNNGDVRIALNAVGPHPFRARNAERVVKAGSFDAESIEKAAAAAAAESEPFTDPIATEWYRRKMAGVFVQRALAQAAAQEV